MSAPPPIPELPPPPPRRYTEPRPEKSPAVRIIVGLPIGLVLGFAAPLSITWTCGSDGIWSRDSYAIGIGVAVLIVAAVPWLWRRGSRGLPIGLAIGVSLPLLLLVACAAHEWSR